MKIIFMGTPDFAVPTLEAIIDAGHEVIGVVTQPDRPRGRGQKIAPSPVKEVAEKYGLAIYQPEKVKDASFVAKLKELNPEAIVVVAFGQLLSPEILNIPRLGCINVHASLLPRYRGAAPIHWAIINGEKESGVTTMYMAEGLDTGDMILKREVPIGETDTVGILHDKLAQVGGQLLIETLESLANKTATRTPQNDGDSNYAPMIYKKDELIDWSCPAIDIYNRIRGMNPWPGAYTFYNGKVLKLWGSEIQKGLNQEKPGTVIDILPKRGLIVAAGADRVILTEVQPQGSRRMGAPDFLRGNQIEKGIVLGN